MAVLQERVVITQAVELSSFPYGEYRKASSQLGEHDIQEIARRSYGSAQFGVIHYPYDNVNLEVAHEQVALIYGDTGTGFLGDEKKILRKGSDVHFAADGAVHFTTVLPETQLIDTITVSPGELSVTRESHGMKEDSPQNRTHDIVVFPRIVPTALLTLRDIETIAERSKGVAVGRNMYYPDQKVQVYFGESGFCDQVTMSFTDNGEVSEDRRSLQNTITVFYPDGTVRFVTTSSTHWESGGEKVSYMTLSDTRKSFGRYEITAETDSYILEAVTIAKAEEVRRVEKANEWVRTHVPPGNNR